MGQLWEVGNQLRLAAAFGQVAEHLAHGNASAPHTGLAKTNRGIDGYTAKMFPDASIRHRSSARPAAGNDDGFVERVAVFLLADRIHRPKFRQQRIDQRAQPRPRRAMRE